MTRGDWDQIELMKELVALAPKNATKVAVSVTASGNTLSYEVPEPEKEVANVVGN